MLIIDMPWTERLGDAGELVLFGTYILPAADRRRIRGRGGSSLVGRAPAGVMPLSSSA